MMDRGLHAGLRALGRTRAPQGFAGAVRRAIGSDAYVVVEAPWGDVFVAHNASGVSAARRAASAREFETWFRTSFGRPAHTDPEPELMRERLRRALIGQPVDLQFDLADLTGFECSVLGKALEIPRGQVRTYGWIALEIGRPRAVRAVGTALAHNPIPYLIPCHRVVRSDGTIGQYSGGGPAAKLAVLAAEGMDIATLRVRG